jgi:type II secretory pathway predicted ATPase ExeA
MQADHSSLGHRAFGEGADNLTTVRYRSYHDALSFLQSAMRGPNGVALLRGPQGAGKTTTLREFAMHLARDADVAFVGGRQLKPRGLLTKILNQFGFDTQAESDDELLQAIGEFAIQQTRSWQAPVLIVDDADRMYPSTLRLLNTLAALSTQGRFALRLVLSGDKGLEPLSQSEGMTSLIQRSPDMFDLQPLSAKETMIYLHARLQAAGSDRADTVFPFDVCDRLREQSGGWPGRLNHFALEAIKRAAGFPISVVDTYAPADAPELTPDDLPVLGKPRGARRLPPRLIVSKDGKPLLEYTFNEKKVLIGRSDFADVVIEDDFVSKLHVMLLLYTDALVLLDLNSANGTTVNSVKVSKTILKDGDIISLGHHRLKIEDAPPISADMEAVLKSPDTLRMKNLIDIRRRRASRRMKLVKDQDSADKRR